MTKSECVQIMAMLNAFYAGGKNDPKMQATAWYLVLGKYDYRIASQAVLNYAENDTREYATFPAVGCIVAEIKKLERQIEAPIKETISAVCHGRDYEQLSDNAKLLISRDKYDEWLHMNAEKFNNNSSIYADELRNRQKLIGGINGEEDQQQR